MNVSHKNTDRNEKNDYDGHDDDGYGVLHHLGECTRQHGKERKERVLPEEAGQEVLRAEAGREVLLQAGCQG
jgi:hypothetical protein